MILESFVVEIKKINIIKNKNKKLIKKINLLDKSNNDFWCKKFEKCKIKIKKINPTPKSITQRNPTNISPSSNKSKHPKFSK